MKLYYINTNFNADYDAPLILKNEEDVKKLLKNKEYELKDVMENCQDIDVFLKEYENYNQELDRLMNEIEIHKDKFKTYMKENKFYIKYFEMPEDIQTLDVGNVDIGLFEDIENQLVFTGKKLFNVLIERLYNDHKELSFVDDRSKIRNEIAKINEREINNKKDVVYFIGDKENKVVKIGYTNDIKNRLQVIQTGYPRKLEVFTTINGDMKLERQLHDKFSKYRLHGEWFELCEEINDYIENNK